MSLLIKGMEMPENCGKCPCCNWSDELDIYCCSALKGQPIIFNTSTKCSDCPLSEIPTPHGDLIDRDKLIQLFLPIMEFPEDERIMYVDMFIRALKNAPTIIEAEG